MIDETKPTISKSKSNSIKKLELLVKECDKSISRHGEDGFVFTNPIEAYHPFTVNKRREVPFKAINFKHKLKKEINRLKRVN
ncbi:MAG: hypothetical protein K8E24_014475 [Methanobacterium paludis]|nr:hypothetical protein [Methanobacterium paludis]